MASAEYQREWRKRNPDKYSQYCKKWQQNNPDKFSLSLKNWRNNNQEFVKEYSKEYNRKNLARLVTNNRNKRAKRKNLSGSHTHQDIQDLLLKQEYLCNGCKIFLVKYDVDHIVPQSRGGSNGPENLQILCPSCNRQKCDKTMEEWILYKERLEKLVNG